MATEYVKRKFDFTGDGEDLSNVIEQLIPDGYSQKREGPKLIIMSLGDSTTVGYFSYGSLELRAGIEINRAVEVGVIENLEKITGQTPTDFLSDVGRLIEEYNDSIPTLKIIGRGYAGIASPPGRGFRGGPPSFTSGIKR